MAGSRGMLSVLLCLAGSVAICQCQDLPLIITTWQSTTTATQEAWRLLYTEGGDVLDSLVGGCSVCEINKTCGSSVGYGDKPDENGETTLDAMVMDGRTMEMGSVLGIRRIKNAIGVARAVLKHTEHSILVGELATEFAIQMGFQEESLNNTNGDNVYNNWLNNNCQPNYWTDVSPDPAFNCGPYTPVITPTKTVNQRPHIQHKVDISLGLEPEHDTIGMVAIDAAGAVSAGATTNGMTHKIPGRSGDTPVVGAGSYAEAGVGGAAATGDGDVMVRMLPTFHAVQLMAAGMSPMDAAAAVVQRMITYFPGNAYGLVTANVTGGYGAACHNFGNFAHHYITPSTGIIENLSVPCI